MPKEGWGKKGTQVLLWQDTLPVTSNWLFGSFPTSSVVSIHPVTHSDFCSVSLMWTFSIASVLCTEPCCSTAYWANTVVCGRQMLGWGYFRRKKKQTRKDFTHQNEKTPPQVGIQVRQEKKYLYSGIGYPASSLLKYVCANDDVYQGKNIASNHVSILSSCWGMRVLLVGAVFLSL